MMAIVRRYTDTLAELAILYAGALVVAAWSFSRFEHRDIWSSVYWAFITSMSIGYGDISPATVPGQVTSILLGLVTLFGIIPLLIVRLTQKVIEDHNAFTHEEQEEVLGILRRLDRHTKGPAA